MREPDADACPTARSQERLTGSILGRRYRLDEQLAEGGFGVIYRATDLAMGREVALKVLRPALASNPEVLERFRREAGALARLRDPHTITLYDAGRSEDGTRFLVLELLRGETLLARFSREGRLPWRRVAAIARGACSALREAHAAGIVHRDVTPANLFLERRLLEDDHVKLLDFGIAKLVDGSDLIRRELTLTGQMIGTLDYMSPEQLIGGACTGKSDVFALAVVIYEMIAGVRPFAEARGPAALLAAMLGSSPAALSSHPPVPAALDHAISRALSCEPELRPDIDELDALLEDSLAAGAERSRADQIARVVAEAARDAEDDPTWIDAPPRAPWLPGETLIGTVAPEKKR